MEPKGEGVGFVGAMPEPSPHKPGASWDGSCSHGGEEASAPHGPQGGAGVPIREQYNQALSAKGRVRAGEKGLRALQGGLKWPKGAGVLALPPLPWPAPAPSPQPASRRAWAPPGTLVSASGSDPHLGQPALPSLSMSTSGWLSSLPGSGGWLSLAYGKTSMGATGSASSNLVWWANFPRDWWLDAQPPLGAHPPPCDSDGCTIRGCPTGVLQGGDCSELRPVVGCSPTVRK